MMFSESDRFIKLDSLLSEGMRERFRWLLVESGQISWEKPRSPFTASRGNVLQMSAESKEECLVFDMFCRHLVSAAYERIEQLWPNRLHPSRAVMQHFSVLMDGCAAEGAPHQVPHRDNFAHGGCVTYPELTLIYYVTVQDLDGGCLFGHLGEGVELVAPVFELAPVENTLVLIPGDQTHSVSPVLNGRRLSVVSNLYRSQD
ncbi:2OG-Fe(II) oxygenase [Paraburkholderia caledonica]|uniref:Fe2OG dioxygenase domain-containing protein n=1 Tax=Paraburkholderia caledonica TaxID=134536 RepID=A0AB73IN85_9BURK|nr:hypothetical protein [Paraburkholderia caledonica]